MELARGSGHSSKKVRLWSSRWMGRRGTPMTSALSCLGHPASTSSLCLIILVMSGCFSHRIRKRCPRNRENVPSLRPQLTDRCSQPREGLRAEASEGKGLHRCENPGEGQQWRGRGRASNSPHILTKTSCSSGSFFFDTCFVYMQTWVI